jgi:hypothetical protein
MCAGCIRFRASLMAMRRTSWIDHRIKDSVAIFSFAVVRRFGFFGGGGLALAIPYTIPNVTTTAHRLQSTPLRPAWIRSPGRLQNTFANESFLDQIAAAIDAP